MRRVLRRVGGAAAAAGLAMAGLVAAAAPASAAACDGTSGVTVVVDFGGGSVQTRCAAGDPSSGLAALAAAGFSTTMVQTQPGFVCRINGAPASDPCRNTPPTSAYWSYWHAQRGGSWSYSNLGAASYDPKPGSVEGWRFGGGSAPSVAPPAPTRTSAPEPTRTSTPKTTTSTPKATTSRPKATTSRPRSSTSAPTRTSTGGSTSSGGGTSSTPSSSRSSSASPSPSDSPSTSRSPSASPTPSASTSTTPTPGEDAEAPAGYAAEPVSGDGSGGSGTLLAGLGLVALVAGAAGWTLWRRSHST